jgi:hypothetical protein
MEDALFEEEDEGEDWHTTYVTTRKMWADTTHDRN